MSGCDPAAVEAPFFITHPKDNASVEDPFWAFINSDSEADAVIFPTRRQGRNISKGSKKIVKRVEGEEY